MNAKLFILFMALTYSLTACVDGVTRKVKMDAYPSFQSAWVAPRQIEVLLPADYDPSKTYDVLYMHDGQNVFNQHTAFAGVAWEVQWPVRRLMNQGRIRPVIIVAIWNSPLRMREYMPAKPKELIQKKTYHHDWEGEPLSDEYLKFLVEELKPFIDDTYSTNPERESTFIMGSSMGGLISLYALAEYPEVFGGAACISTHWPALDGIFLEYVARYTPPPGNHKLYFDYGTATLDSVYEPYQLRVDSMLNAMGFTRGKDWVTHRFEGASHTEKDWGARIHIPLQFLLGTD